VRGGDETTQSKIRSGCILHVKAKSITGEYPVPMPPGVTVMSKGCPTTDITQDTGQDQGQKLNAEACL
jgi:hypothetical protein